MKTNFKTLCQSLPAIVLATAGAFCAWAQAPIPLIIDSRSPTAPGIDPYQASLTKYRLYFTDGTNATDLTGRAPWMSWSSNSYATGSSTASCVVVDSKNGIVDATFSASSLNPTFGPGRYMYEVGLRGSQGITVYRQGVLTLRGSPYAVGVSPAAWTTNAVNWGSINWTGLPTDPAGWGFTEWVTMAEFNSVSGQVVTAQADIDTHEALTGTNVHGLGTASVHASNDFATVAQGAKADTALQSEADTNAIVRLNTHTNLPAMTAHFGLGTAATNPAGAFATATQGTTADTAAANAVAALAGVLAQSNRINIANTATNALQIQVASLSGATNALNARTVNLESATNALNARAGASETATNSLNSEILTLKSSTNALQTQATALQGATSALNTATNTLQTQVTAIKSATNSLQTKIDALNISTAAQQIAVASLQVSTNSLNTRAGALETATNSLSADMSSLSDASNFLNSAVAALNTSTGSLNTTVIALKTATNNLQSQATIAIAATNALQIQATALQGATSSLNSSVIALKSATNSLDDRVFDLENAGYLTASTNLFQGITIADRSKLGTNLSGLTQGTYTGVISSVAYTGVTALTVGKTYAWGFTKQNTFGTSTLSIASFSLIRTASGAVSNYFTFVGTGSNLVLRLDGDGSSKSDVSSIYVKQITNGTMSLAGDMNIGGILYFNGVASTDFKSVAFSANYGDLTNKPTLGTAAALDSTNFATAAQGALADTALQPGADGTGTNLSQYNNDAGFADSNSVAATYVPTNGACVTNARSWAERDYSQITNPPAIPSTNGLASTNWVKAQGYITGGTIVTGATASVTTNNGALDFVVPVSYDDTALKSATNVLNIATGALNTAVGNLNTATNALNNVVGILNTNALLKTGGIMSGPVTNTVGYYGNGVGLTNVPELLWSAKSNDVPSLSANNSFAAASTNLFDHLRAESLNVNKLYITGESPWSWDGAQSYWALDRTIDCQIHQVYPNGTNVFYAIRDGRSNQRYMEVSSNYVGFPSLKLLGNGNAGGYAWTNIGTIQATNIQLTGGNLNAGGGTVTNASNIGEAWVSPTYTAGNFYGSASMTWTVEVGDVVTLAYVIFNKTMTVAITLYTTSIGGTPDYSLCINMPPGKTAAASVFTTCRVINGDCQMGFLHATETNISISLSSGSPWAISTNATFIEGEITFPIQ